VRLHKENLIKEMAPKPKQPAGPAMTLGNMRQLGVQRLLASCLNDACRHTALIDVSNYPADTEVPWFRSRVVCAKWRRAQYQDRCATELERAAAKREPDRQAVAIKYLQLPASGPAALGRHGRRPLTGRPQLSNVRNYSPIAPSRFALCQ
jgi:hypothetical protein